MCAKVMCAKVRFPYVSATPIPYPRLRRLGSRRLLVVTPLAVVAVAGMGMLGARARVPDNQIAPGVQVGGLKLGGKSPEEARALLTQWSATRQTAPVHFTFAPDTHITKTWTADAHKLGLGVDVAATLDDVNRAGREGMLGQVSHLLTGSKTIAVPAHVTVDTDQLRAYLKQVAYQVNRKPRNARLKLAGTSIAAYIHDKPGLGMDVDGGIAVVTQSWTRYNGGVPASSTPDAPAPPEPSASSTPAPVTNPAASGTDTGSAAPPVAADPNAHQKPGGGQGEGETRRQGDKGTKAGGGASAVSASSASASEAVSAGLSEGTGRLDVELPVKTTPAAIAYEDITQINGVLGKRETDIGGTSNRLKNVALAASRINGTVLRPGEVFSYNKVVGHRTVEAGFFEAPEIVKGALKPGVGGGVCQVSSTLFNAALLSGLKIVDRSHHAFPVHYLPAGLDATVVDGDIDFRFANNTDTPIYIYGNGRGGVLKFRIYGKTDPTRQIELVRGVRKEGDFGSETETDDSLPAGRRETKTPGHPRIDVTWYRVIKENGVEVKRDTITTHYRSIPAIVLVGTRAPRVRSTPSAGKANASGASAANAAPAPDTNAAPTPN